MNDMGDTGGPGVCLVLIFLAFATLLIGGIVILSMHPNGIMH